jgi:hypothetical protein
VFKGVFISHMLGPAGGPHIGQRMEIGCPDRLGASTDGLAVSLVQPI